MNNARQKEHQTIYAFARCEQFLEDYARSNHLPANEFTAGVAELLLAQTRGQVLGSTDHLSALRGEATELHSSSREVALARSTHRGAQKKVRRSDAGKPKDPKRIVRIQKMVDRGLSTKDIAKRLGVDPSGVYSYAIKHGITLNPSPKGPSYAA